ncbi:MAG: hypothetical protein IJ124_06085 [Clostridia bacterium]|nr:hypothetical protein [Clostridia bacterium]
MSLFDRLGGGQPQQQMTPQQTQQMTPQTAMRQLRQNPTGTLKQAGFNVPDGMSNPRDMVMHILQSGQADGPRMQAARQMMARMGLK